MNNETYEALKELVKFAKNNIPYYVDRQKGIKFLNDIKRVEGWIDEVAKEYDE